MRKYFYLLSTAILAGIISWAGKNGTMEITNNNGKAGFTGSPGEQTCVSCHSGTLNSGSGNVTINSNIPPAGYTAGQTYQIDVVVTDATSNLFGFGFEALFNSGNTNAGSFTITNSASTQIKTASVSGNMRNNVVHTLNGGSGSGSKTFTFNWTAPAAGSGDVRFYAVGNATNGNNNTSGDKVYSTVLPVSEFNSSSVAELNNTISHVSVYPNPVSESFTLKFFSAVNSEISIQLLDLTGKLVLNLGNIQSSGEVNQTFQLPSQLSSGLYLISIGTSTEKQIEKLFIQK